MERIYIIFVNPCYNDNREVAAVFDKKEDAELFAHVYDTERGLGNADVECCPLGKIEHVRRFVYTVYFDDKCRLRDVFEDDLGDHIYEDVVDESVHRIVASHEPFYDRYYIQVVADTEEEAVKIARQRLDEYVKRTTN